jgi:predicted AAA+ superfamily ATPase
MAEWHSRYLESTVREDIEKKMVFIGGPRQVGKTIFARIISSNFRSPAYLNWDSRTHRHLILKEQWSPDTDLLVFDELHKYPKWKQWIKGIWDTRRHNERIIVTGSSRMDIFRRGGDSLLGRYHYYRLHPFSLREISGMKAAGASLPKHFPELRFEGSFAMSDLETLWRFGGFPEPLLSGNERTLKRWQKERFERVFHEDIRDTEAVRSLAQVELLAGILPERVGSPLSMNSLVEDIEASPKTVKTWLELLCRNYYIFRVPPYHRRLDRALKKESKYYFWDWSEVKDDGARFENMVASHLLKWCHYYNDQHGIDAQLYYVRDVEKREVDFLIVWEKQPCLLVECKISPGRDFTHLKYFANKIGIKRAYLVVMQGGVDYEDKRTGIRVIPAVKFFGALV